MGLHANKVGEKMGPIKEELSHLEEKKREAREGKSNTQQVWVQPSAPAVDQR